jgi:hypothetical protein
MGDRYKRVNHTKNWLALLLASVVSHREQTNKQTNKQTTNKQTNKQTQVKLSLSIVLMDCTN